MLNRVFFTLVFILLPFVTKADQEAITVRVTKAQITTFFEKFSSFGECKSNISKPFIANITAGTVDSIRIKSGQDIKAGEIVMTIDKDIAERDKAKATANIKTAETAYKRDQILFNKKMISKEALEKRYSALETAKAEYTRALNNYKNMVLSAPFDGKIGVIMPRIGERVREGDFLFSIVASESKNITFSMPETLHGKINNDTEVILKDSRGNEAIGSVIAISPYLNDLGVINIKVEMEKGENFIHGSYVEGEFIINKHEALGILEQAVLKNDKGNFIYKVDENNIVKQVFITLGNRTGKMIEIKSPEIKEGDLIVLEGLTKVKAGSAVKIMEP